MINKLAKIQKELVAPKGQFNNFGKYKYRSCEDILEAVKPLLDGAIILLSDQVVEVGGRVYVKATAVFCDGGEEPIEVSAYAREAENKKGMDDSQITGTASSYARKYALNGLLLCDDVADADTMDNSDGGAKKTTPVKPKFATEAQAKMLYAVAMSNGGKEALTEVLKAHGIKGSKDIPIDMVDDLKKELEARESD